MGTPAMWLGAAISSTAIAIAQNTVAPLPRPLDLLDQAYQSSRYHPPQERTLTLYFLSQAAEPMSKNRTREWSTEMFHVALQGGTRDSDAAQKNALVILSRVDPAKAADLFRDQILPKKEAGVEDPRPYGAEAVFPALYEAQGLKAIDQIEMLALWLGQTGQYPYEAMAAILKSVAKKDPSRAQLLWAQATMFFKDDPGYRGTERFLVDFLLKTYEVPAPGALAKTVRAAVDWLERRAEAAANATGKTDAQILEMRAADRTFRFGSDEELQIFRLMPLMRQIDAEWASQVVKRHESMNGLPEMGLDANYTTGGVIVQDPATTSAAAVQKAMGESRLRDVEAAATTDPAAAMRMANGIASPMMRDLARALVLPSYTAAGDQDGKEILGELAKKLDNLDASVEKVRLEIAMAQSYYGMQDSENGDALAERALSTGSAIFKQQLLAEPGKLTYTIAGFDQLLDAAQLLGSKSTKPWNALQEIDQFQVDVMRPRLVARFAQGLTSRPSARSGSASAAK